MTYDPLFYPKRCDEFPDCRCAERLRSIHLLIDEYLDPAKPQPDRDDVVATITWAFVALACIATRAPDRKARARARREMDLPVFAEDWKREAKLKMQQRGWKL
jgi:hypothetical protein